MYHVRDRNARNLCHARGSRVMGCALDFNCQIRMAEQPEFNIYTTYYESFLALSVSIRVDKLQLMMETASSGQAPVLRYRDITFTTEYLKEALSEFFPVLGVHNVARVRQGATLPLFEVDFTDEKALEIFCKSMSSGKYISMTFHATLHNVYDAGVIQTQLHDLLKRFVEQEVDVTVKLHLIMPNAEKKSPVSREVTTANYRECFTLITESALFEFRSLDIAHDSEQMLCKDDSYYSNCIKCALFFTGIDDLPELLQELTEVAADWYLVGIFLKIANFRLDAIKNDNYNQSMNCLRDMLATWLKGTDAASRAALVQALGFAGRVRLAKKMAVKYGENCMSSLFNHHMHSIYYTTLYTRCSSCYHC